MTIAEVKQVFADKGIDISIPLPDEIAVKSLNVLEKHPHADGMVLLLEIRFITSDGKEEGDIFHCTGSKKAKTKSNIIVSPGFESLKSEMLSLRERETFEDDVEVYAFLRDALIHLLLDKGYHLEESEYADLYFKKDEKEFFANMAIRCDESGFEQAKKLIELRCKAGSAPDYGLIVPAFQESLGIPFRVQEQWIYKHGEYLSVQRIGVYAVDNWDPNRIYPLTIYSRGRDLAGYFVTTSQQWSLIRSRYVAERAKRKTSS